MAKRRLAAWQLILPGVEPKAQAQGEKRRRLKRDEVAPTCPKCGFTSDHWYDMEQVGWNGTSSGSVRVCGACAVRMMMLGAARPSGTAANATP